MALAIGLYWGVSLSKCILIITLQKVQTHKSHKTMRKSKGRKMDRAGPQPTALWRSKKLNRKSSQGAYLRR